MGLTATSEGCHISSAVGKISPCGSAFTLLSTAAAPRRGRPTPGGVAEGTPAGLAPGGRCAAAAVNPVGGGAAARSPAGAPAAAPTDTCMFKDSSLESLSPSAASSLSLSTSLSARSDPLPAGAIPGWPAAPRAPSSSAVSVSSAKLSSASALSRCTSFSLLTRPAPASPARYSSVSLARFVRAIWERRITSTDPDLSMDSACLCRLRTTPPGPPPGGIMPSTHDSLQNGCASTSSHCSLSCGSLARSPIIRSFSSADVLGGRAGGGSNNTMFTSSVNDVDTKGGRPARHS
mmetsp:Transcript_13022/g.24878  ORF Transcript_13022/g.24878 Transcript_13022/m.24878 type:complete len:291 (+) Transcript_13022:1348-2220(+)